MAYVITEACIGVKDRACVDVCPVDCIYEIEEQLVINPDECIDCGACEPECPVSAIFPEDDVPANLKAFIEKNKMSFQNDPAPGRPKR
jgi:NAD-dependent dihydropyrimidine dehydrogenase PreA subunit